MKQFFFAAVAASGLAGAASYGDMIFAIEKAQARVIVFAPSIYDVELAEAIRRARTDPIRKISVRILSVAYYNYQPRSVMLSLALAGVPVYEAQIASTSGVIIVDNEGWKSEYLGQYSKAAVTKMTATEINRTLKWFEASLKKGNVLTQVEAFERLKKVTP